MRDWATHLDKILTATGERLLTDAGRVSHDQAVEKAKSEYVKYQARTLSDVEKQYLASPKMVENFKKEMNGLPLTDKDSQHGQRTTGHAATLFRDHFLSDRGWA